jgi:hypothetical protein
MTRDEAMTILRNHIEKEGSMRAFADKHDFNVSFISDIMRGRREPSERILLAVGVKKVVTYEFI